MNSTGEWRRAFYDKVVGEAKAQTVRCVSLVFSCLLIINFQVCEGFTQLSERCRITKGSKDGPRSAK